MSILSLIYRSIVHPIKRSINHNYVNTGNRKMGMTSSSMFIDKVADDKIANFLSSSNDSIRNKKSLEERIELLCILSFNIS